MKYLYYLISILICIGAFASIGSGGWSVPLGTLAGWAIVYEWRTL